MLSRREILAGAIVSGACKSLEALAQPLPTMDFRLLRALRGTPPESVLSYDGSVPGPTLRVKQGEELRVRLFNGLSEPTTIHWHGVRLPNAMDGVPALTQPAVMPTSSFDYRFRCPDAGTFWYHAQSSAQLDAGLYGALIVEEPGSIAVDRDVILMLAATDDAQAGGAVLVNGSLRPDIGVISGERLRLRLINASGKSGLNLRIDRHAAWVMGVDGQPAEPFVARDGRVGLAPGSRLDLFVDATLDIAAAAPILAGSRDESPIARLVYAGGGRPLSKPRSPPAPLPSNSLPAWIDLKTALRAEWRIAASFPGPVPRDPLFSVARGRAVSLAVNNGSGRPQVMHLHGHHFRLLDRLDDGWKPFWLDTLVVGEQVERIAFVADNPGKWLLEARMLDTRAAPAAVWFAVT
jgi:FtsP/CotA-like multicopper oxidase with cupredoxin domain